MGIHELKAIYENLLYPIFGELFRIDDSDEDKNWVVIILDGTREDFYFSLYLQFFLSNHSFLHKILL